MDINDSLIMASQEGKTKIVKLLLDKGADVNYVNKYGRTSLLLASAFGCTETVKLLIENGADINYVDKHGFNSLLVASWYDRTETVNFLFEKGANVDNVNLTKSNNNCLVNALCYGHIEIVKLLLEKIENIYLIKEKIIIMIPKSTLNVFYKYLIESNKYVIHIHE